QVFMNILSNAIDAIDDHNYQRHIDGLAPIGGKIQITTEISPSNRILIHMGDNGPGIPESIQSKLFDPFFTTKPVGQGTGLGLSISYQIIVEKHGGQLTHTSELGEGTVFTISLPLPT
ncbi:MAG: ATP-binding protein, partial [Cyanobacteria bacterium J06642_11]